MAAASPPNVSESTLLAVDRTRLAHERTLMAWVRTATSMISFGFTIGKFLDYLANQADSRLPLGEHNLLPKLLVLIGLASLFIGIWEHRHLMVELGGVEGHKHVVAPIGIVASLVALLGILAFAGLFIPL